MLQPPSPLPARHSLLAFATLLLVLVAAIPSAFSLHSAGAAASAGATGNDPRPFPKTFHIWGGAPSNYTKYDIVIGYPSWNLASLRAANPGAIYLANPMLDPFNPDWTQRKGTAVTYGAAGGFTGATDTISDGSAANLGQVPAWNAYWDTLHRPDGTVAPVSDTWKHPGWNLTRTETAEKVAEITAYATKLSKIQTNGWDGIWSDNWIYRIGASWFYGSNLDTNRDGLADNISVVQRQWWDGLTLVGNRLRSYLPGKIVGGNGAHHVTGLAQGADPNGPFKSTNITMYEVLELYTSRPDTIVSDVQSYLAFPDPLGMPRYFLLMHRLPGGQADYRSMRWGFSLTTIAGAYYEPYANGHADAFSYDEFTGGAIGKRGWLGQAVSAPTKLANGVWRRDFQNGVVLNNSTASAQTVALGGSYNRLKGTQDSVVNNGAAVTSVTIAAGDGLFLRGATTSSTSPPQNMVLPTISGVPVIGGVLTATSGSWSGTPTSYAYQWQRCDAVALSCADVVGAKNTSYTLSELDAGSRMRVKVTATNAGGSTTAVSAITGTVPEAFGVTQSIADGSTLSSTVNWSASPAGKTVSKVDFSVDGKVVASDISSPYSTALSTTSLANGPHTFAVRATATDGTFAAVSVNAYVSNQTPSPTPTLTVTQSLTDGQKLSGSILWSATASGKSVAKLEFGVDGVVVSTDSAAPYEVALDTKRFADGGHDFAVKAVATDGTSASSTASVTVSNTTTTPPSPTFSVSQNIAANQVVSGTLDWVAEASGKPVKRMEFTVDGAKVATIPKAPYQTSFDTSKLAEGTHGFGVVAHAANGGTARTYALVTVANRTAAPAPTASLSLSQSIGDGGTLSGLVSWTVSPAGKTVARVEFFVDGRLSWTENFAPYVFSGDGNRLDTRTLADGPHTLSVKAHATDGSTATESATVVVSNAVASVTLVSSIKDESTITGEVSWTITPTGKAVSRMDFYIDDTLKWTERLSPWVYGGDNRKLDTSRLSKGKHTLVVKAYVSDGTVVVLTLTVTVS